jgi:hypothetical protein
MAHFAKLDENNIVLTVDVVSNDVVNNLDFPESEPIGVEFLNTLFNESYIWKQTSYNGSFRVRYAGIGYYYLEEYDAFIEPKPFDSWVINNKTIDWEAPIPYPNDGKNYKWDESVVNWVEVTYNEDTPTQF